MQIAGAALIKAGALTGMNTVASERDIDKYSSSRVEEFQTGWCIAKQCIDAFCPVLIQQGSFKTDTNFFLIIKNIIKSSSNF